MYFVRRVFMSQIAMLLSHLQYYFVYTYIRIFNMQTLFLNDPKFICNLILLHNLCTSWKFGWNPNRKKVARYFVYIVVSTGTIRHGISANSINYEQIEKSRYVYKLVRVVKQRYRLVRKASRLNRGNRDKDTCSLCSETGSSPLIRARLAGSFLLRPTTVSLRLYL